MKIAKLGEECDGAVFGSHKQYCPIRDSDRPLRSFTRSWVQVGASCRVGNFVELKNSTLGSKTNVAHLSYLGDATLGDRMSISVEVQLLLTMMV